MFSRLSLLFSQAEYPPITPLLPPEADDTENPVRRESQYEPKPREVWKWHLRPKGRCSKGGGWALDPFDPTDGLLAFGSVWSLSKTRLKLALSYRHL